MTWSRFSLDGPAGARLIPDAVRYGPGLPHEDALKLLGYVDGRRVLELGCGVGSAAVALARAGAKVIAVDESPDALAETRDNANRHDVRVEAHRASLAELAFVRAETVDAALSIYGLAAVADIDRVFRQVHRVLRQERPLVFSLPHPAFNLLDPNDPEPRMRRRWWDPRPITWSAARPDAEPDIPRTLSSLFTSLGRANFRVDAVLEPVPDQATCPDGTWSDQMNWVPPTLIIRARKEGL
ncbi:MAG: class I SAM-dependent methyltransferase [Acidimicrobiales bacterium]